MQVYRPHALTITDAVEMMPFAVLLPTKLPWEEDEVAGVAVHYLTPLVPGYFGRLGISYRNKRGAALRVCEGDTSPRIDAAIRCDFSDSDHVEKEGRAFKVVSPTGDIGECYVAFEHKGTHVVICASGLERERVVEFAASFKVARRKHWRRLSGVVARQGPVGIGVALGLIAGVIDGVTSRRDFSVGTLFLWIIFFGLAGYIFRCALNRVRRPTGKFAASHVLCAGGVWDPQMDS
jgi:hypothetical protein